MSKIESNYKLRKRIEILEQRLCKADNDLHLYKQTVLEIFDTITTHVQEDKTTSMAWILKTMRRCFR